MADLLSELERFEQEMKELGAVSDSSSPPSPSLDAIGPSSSVDASSLISDASASSFSKNNSTVITGTINAPTASASGALATSSVPARSSSVIPPSSPLNSLPPSTPVATMLSAAQHSPWLVSGAATTSTTLCSLPMSNASPASALSQFTYSTPPLSYIPSPPVAATDTPVQAVTSTAAAPYFPVPFHIQQHQQQQPVQYQQQQYLQQYQPQQYQQQPQATVIQAPQYTYPTVFQPPIPLPQQQQAQQLFQRDAQTITPEALESVKAALASGDNDHKAEIKRKAIPRKAAGQSWEDPTLVEWPENDYRLFCGDLGNEVNDEVLTKAFSRFPSFNMARVVRDKRTGKTRGYGFVSFSNPSDLAQAMKEMNGKYVGNRPIKLRKSTWKERTDYDALQKQKFSQKTKKSKTAKKNILHK